MSEYQIVAFRAIDGPVSKANLEYMERQSSRAEITPWSFDNEYNYSDFRGNAEEMLRRGYDLHLHYANFGTRKLLVRLPSGLPNAEAAAPYLDGESLRFEKDKKGPGGILCIEPFHESGDLDDLWEIDDLVERFLPLRAEIIAGDLRPFYVAHLAATYSGYQEDEEPTEGPVPAGLNKLTDAQLALAELYGLDESLLAAAARGCPPLPPQRDPEKQHAQWLQNQPVEKKDEWLAQMMADAGSAVRAQILTEYRKSAGTADWPSVRLDRTIAELESTAEEIQRATKLKAAKAAERAQVKKLAAMFTDPTPTIRETERLVAERSSDNYAKVAVLLAELREALAGTKQAALAEQQAVKLRSKNPTLSRLVSELRKQGFLKK